MPQPSRKEIVQARLKSIEGEMLTVDMTLDSAKKTHKEETRKLNEERQDLLRELSLLCTTGPSAARQVPAKR